MIALIDYKAGNLTSVRKAFAAIGAELYDPASPADLERAAAIVVPGVGHFGATAALDRDWVAAIRARVADGRPLLGICLGLQWLFAGSEEAPDCPGLGLLSGTCYRLERIGASKFPMSGGTAWPSSLEDWEQRRIIVAGVASGSQVYFTHSFVAPVTERHRGRHRARRAVRGNRPAGPNRRRSVSSGEVRRGGAADPPELVCSCVR